MSAEFEGTQQHQPILRMGRVDVSPNAFPQALARIAISRGYQTPEDIAHAMKITLRTPAIWLKGVNPPSPEYFGGLLRLLKPTAEELEHFVNLYQDLLSQGKVHEYYGGKRISPADIEPVGTLEPIFTSDAGEMNPEPSTSNLGRKIIEFPLGEKLRREFHELFDGQETGSPVAMALWDYVDKTDHIQSFVGIEILRQQRDELRLQMKDLRDIHPKGVHRMGSVHAANYMTVDRLVSEIENKIKEIRDNPEEYQRNVLKQALIEERISQRSSEVPEYLDAFRKIDAIYIGLIITYRSQGHEERALRRLKQLRQNIVTPNPTSSQELSS